MSFFFCSFSGEWREKLLFSINYVTMYAKTVDAVNRVDLGEGATNKGAKKLIGRSQIIK